MTDIDSNAPVATLIECLYAKDTKSTYATFQALEELARKSAVFYPYTDLFAQLTQSKEYAQRVRGFRLFCRQAKLDRDNKIDENLDLVLTMLNDPKPTAVRMALSALSDIWDYKKELRGDLIFTLGQINYARYKDSMQGLIAKDVQKILQRE